MKKNTITNTELTNVPNVLEELFSIIIDALDFLVKMNSHMWEFRYNRVSEYRTLTREVQGFVIKIYDLEALNQKGGSTEPIYEIPLILWTDITSPGNEVMIKFPVFDQLPISPDGWYIPSRGFVPAPGCRDEAEFYMTELQAFWKSAFDDESGK